MRRHLVLTLCFLLAVPGTTLTSAPSLPAASVLPKPVSLPAASLSEAVKIGVAAAVKGSVKIDQKGQVGQVVESGQPIFLGDVVKTDAQGSLQILLLDQTIFTIGPNSAMAIDKFIYDPATQNGQVNARVVKGVFRFVTGKIGHKDPSNVEIKLPSGTIGIRGTIVAGEVGDQRSMVVLLGPGDQNNTEHRQGRFILSNGGESQDVSRSGFGSAIEGNQPPSEPFRVPQIELDRITNALGSFHFQNNQPGNAPAGGGSQNNTNNPPPVPPQGSQPSATQQSGQARMGARQSVQQNANNGRFIQKFAREIGTLAQKKIHDEFVGVQNGPTTRDQLNNLATALGPVIDHFKVIGIPLFASGSHVANADVYINIDFGKREIGGGNSRVTGNVLPSTPTFEFSMSSYTLPFGAGADNAGFFFSDIPNSGGSCNSTVCNRVDVFVGIDNFNGQIASGAHIGVRVENISGVDQGTGGAIAETRFVGPSQP